MAYRESPRRTFRAPDSTWERLKMLAKEAHLSASAYLRVLIENAWKARKP